jgi:hypothetical protein
VKNLLGDSTFLQGSAYAQILQSEIFANNKDQINNTQYGGMGVDLKAACFRNANFLNNVLPQQFRSVHPRKFNIGNDWDGV